MTRNDVQHILVFTLAILLVPLIGAGLLFALFRVLVLLLSGPAH